MPPDQLGRDLFVVIRFDAFQMAAGAPFSPQFVTVKRPVYDNLEQAEVEAMRLNRQAPHGAYYFARRLVHPTL